MSNYTALDFGKSTSPLDVFVGLNELTGGWFVGLLLLFIFLIALGLVYTSTRDLITSITTSSFITLLLGLLLWALELIELYFIIIPLVILILMIIVMFFSPRK
jgi:hypothetical protein